MDRQTIQTMTNLRAEIYILILDLGEVNALTPQAHQDLIFRLRDIFEDLDEVISGALSDNEEVLNDLG